MLYHQRLKRIFIFQVLKIAREVTGQTNDSLAKQYLIQKLSKPEMYYNDQPIPKNESDKNAHNNCVSIETAKKYCPVRWRAMSKWFSNARQVRIYVRSGCASLVIRIQGEKTWPPFCHLTRPDLAGGGGFPGTLKIWKYNLGFCLQN